MRLLLSVDVDEGGYGVVRIYISSGYRTTQLNIVEVESTDSLDLDAFRDLFPQLIELQTAPQWTSQPLRKTLAPDRYRVRILLLLFRITLLPRSTTGTPLSSCAGRSRLGPAFVFFATFIFGIPGMDIVAYPLW